MEPQGLCPTHDGPAALGSGLQMVAAQDVPHRERVNAVSQVCQGTLDTAVTPRRVLFRHAHGKPLNLLNDTGSTKLTTPLAPVELLGDQVAIPAQEGAGRDNRGHLNQAFPPERMGECREATAVRVGKTQPAAVELGFEHAIFFIG